MAKKAADKCKYPENIFTSNIHWGKPGEGQNKGESPCNIPVLKIFRKLNRFDSSYIMVSNINTTACLWTF